MRLGDLASRPTHGLEVEVWQPHLREDHLQFGIGFRRRRLFNERMITKQKTPLPRPSALATSGCRLSVLGLSVLLLLGAGPRMHAAVASDSRLDWWRDARFGMFIHWGPVSLKGTEIGWSRGAEVPAETYDQLYREFNPTQFNAEAWVTLAKTAGMKYIVFTSKHHDGFCMWDTKYSDYNITQSPFRRDVVRELADACKRQGVVFCLYHSICDWRHPDYPLGSPGGKTTKPTSNMDRYNQYLKNQLAELIKGYGPLGVLWFDGEWEKPWNRERGIDLYQHVRQLQPNIIINNRVGVGRDGMAGTTTAVEANPGDYDTPEQQVGRLNTTRPWESCITICEQWAWKPNDRMKSLAQCLQTLVTCAGGDGNLLFNVGPMPTGEIEARQVDRLREMGAWLGKYGTSIYGTRGGPFRPGPWGVSTCRGKTAFVHVLKWSDGPLNLPAIPRRVVRSSVLGGGTVEVTRTPNGIKVEVPTAARQEIDTIIVLELDGPAFDALPSA